MAQAKIKFSFGGLSFSGEGEEGWLTKQLDKFLEAAPQLSSFQTPDGDPDVPPKPSGENLTISEKFTKALGPYIKSKGGESNQNKRFLATADWMRQRGAKNLTSTAIKKALSDNHQKKLGNPADCLNKLVGRGVCEKNTDGSFFITPEGLTELGHK